MSKAKPFIKWVGGKGQLLEQLDELLPSDFSAWQEATYIEPFVGGGAMLFYMLQHYPNIKHAVINDINADLIGCYRTVRDNPNELIDRLKMIETEFNGLSTEEERKAYFYAKREKYNEKGHGDVENTSLFFFLNRTCFNGLYRVNKAGGFNVPFGKYVNPTICDAETIMQDSKLLQRVEILNGDFSETIHKAKGNTLFYFDPPYRPLNETSSFNDYTKESFGDAEQIRLKAFCDTVCQAGYHVMLSNSDGKGADEDKGFFDNLYANYCIDRVWARRSVNANAQKRGKLTEIVVHNYPCTKQSAYADNFQLQPYYALR